MVQLYLGQVLGFLFKGTAIWGTGLVLWVKSYVMRRWKFATGQRGSLVILILLFPSFLFLLSSPLAFLSPLELEGTSEQASIEHCLCTTRLQWPPAAFHSPCALKSYPCHPLLWNLLPLYSNPFKLLCTTLRSHNTFSFFKSQHFLSQVLG